MAPTTLQFGHVDSGGQTCQLVRFRPSKPVQLPESERAKREGERDRQSQPLPKGEPHICSLNVWGLVLDRGLCV